MDLPLLGPEVIIFKQVTIRDEPLLQQATGRSLFMVIEFFAGQYAL